MVNNDQENKPEIAGMICGPPARQVQNGLVEVEQSQPVQNGVMEVEQPPQPRNLQGLLRYAADVANLDEAAPQSSLGPLDEERRKFLEKALKSLTIDVIEVLLKQIKLLEKVDTLKPEDDASPYTEALDIIADYICDIDTANDFHRIRGFNIFNSCLKSPNPQVRAKACNLLAELCQNNPYCQKVFLENGLMPLLLNIVETDPEVEVVIKALYGISCNVRQNTPGCSQFIQYRGVQILLEALKRNDEKCNTKICFLLSALCTSQPDFKSRLIFVGYIPALFELLLKEPNSSQEHVLDLLLKLIEDNPSAINECRQLKHNYKDILETYKLAVKGKEEFTDQEEHCDALNNILFADQ